MPTPVSYFDLEIEKIVQENSVIRTIFFNKPEGFNNLPGQFSWVTVPELRQDPNNIPRTPLAIGSGMLEDHLIFSFRNWGGLTKLFFEKKEGDVLSISEPLGSHAPVDLFESNEIICIAGGTGVVPIRSLINSMKLITHPKVFYGARTPSELLYKDEISHWNSEIIVERPDDGATWEGQQGFVTKLLTQSVFDLYKYCYICGPFPMMKNAVVVLRELGYSMQNIYVSLEKVENNQVVGPVLPVSDPKVSFE